MPDDLRQRLLVYLPRIAGSRSSLHVFVRVEIMVRAALLLGAALGGPMQPARWSEEAAAQWSAAWSAISAFRSAAVRSVSNL